MRKSKAEKAETRKHIVDTAARMFKEGGVGATGVGEIMVAAGMTHSAFYRHFASKEELLAEASAASMEVFVDAARKAAEAGPEAFVQYLEDYLSPEYRNDQMGGCPVVQMGSELARADSATREGVSDGLTQLHAFAVGLTDGSVEAEEETVRIMSMITGAIVISRLVNDRVLGEHFLDVIRRSLPKSTTATVSRGKPKKARTPSASKAQSVHEAA
ncbi:TetR/AcrR family transcriptional regulator [Burkholderia cenocepacia]|uniref:TetR/AcrR family transcriptional regulator n=1 Tax=Burkholderia cenocepacia TaxID=95486 RepID=UPI0009E12340|nr:TetR family transcriptional regulator [Burkholderia cenocepacia]ARF86775.1 TetR family transcriptional regulator [Burkholderia cenocepacia]MCW3674617.1 TetR/AcrR family transcriptional regulator [Burkholderia cenocepacia]MDC6082491.1 TetR family transcriptional regulator [Burkholderia cenocepacia]SPV02549.1 transcriptional regulator TetR family [Burkholderia cenocepacia]